MKKKVLAFVALVILLATTSCASARLADGCWQDVFEYDDLEYDDSSYRESKIVETLIVNGIYEASKSSVTVSVAYLLMKNGDVVILPDDVENITLPFSKEEAKTIMLHNSGKRVDIIYYHGD